MVDFKALMEKARAIRNMANPIYLYNPQTGDIQQMSATKNAINPIDLDASLDDIDDLPGFVTFPTGAFVVVLEKGFEQKKINDHLAFEMAMTLKSVEELNPENLDEGEEPPKAGDIATIAFMMDNEFGAGKFKEAAKPIRAATDASTVREIVEASKGLELLVVVKRRKGKKGSESEDKNFMDLTKISVL